MNRNFMIIIALAVLLSQGGFASSGTMSVAYIPIDSDTFVAVTPDNIADYYVRFCTCSIRTKKLNKVLAIIGSAPRGSFNRDFVRVRIAVGENKWVYVDNKGGIRTPNGDFRLERADLDEVKKLLNELTRPRTSK